MSHRPFPRFGSGTQGRRAFRQGIHECETLGLLPRAGARGSATNPGHVSPSIGADPGPVACTEADAAESARPGRDEAETIPRQGSGGPVILCDSGELDADRLRQGLESAFLWAEKEDPDQELASQNPARVIEYLEGRTRTPQPPTPPPPARRPSSLASTAARRRADRLRTGRSPPGPASRADGPVMRSDRAGRRERRVIAHGRRRSRGQAQATPSDTSGLFDGRTRNRSDTRGLRDGQG